MLNSKVRFFENVNRASELGALYDQLVAAIGIPGSFDDLLRSQLVYAVSAFDKLIHDLVRIGMVQAFMGLRPSTEKYLNEGIQLRRLSLLSPGSIPPPAVAFEQIIREKLSVLSFQDPKKLADGLSFIWPEAQKWQVLAGALGMSSDDARTTLGLIATRRNAIVHEADLDPLTHRKQPITRQEAADATSFLRRLGTAICDQVI